MSRRRQPQALGMSGNEQATSAGGSFGWEGSYSSHLCPLQDPEGAWRANPTNGFSYQPLQKAGEINCLQEERQALGTGHFANLA